jgi:pimeloyl-ACP methyl ester carboxylesterase
MAHKASESAPGLIFLHGFGLDGRMWKPQLEAFRDRYRVSAPDLPGFGPNPVDPGKETLTAAVARHCDALALDTVHIVGLSLGGAVAVDFALGFPTRVRSLTLVDALLRGRPSGIQAWDSCAALATQGRLPEAREAWLADPLFAGARRRPEVLASIREMGADYSGEHWAGRATSRLEVPEPASRLGEIDVPSLVVAGSDDLPTFRAMADEYAGALPRARKVILEGVGHVASMEDAPAFNRLLQSFLESVETPELPQNTSRPG